MKRLLFGAVCCVWLLGAALQTWAQGAVNVPLTVHGQSYGYSDLVFGVDPAATDGYDSGLDLPGPPSVPSGSSYAYFLIGSSWYVQDVRAVPGVTPVSYQLKVRFQVPPFNVATEGIYYADLNGNVSRDVDEPIWKDVAGGRPGVYDHGTDVPILDGGNAAWFAANDGARGRTENLYFNDANGDKKYTDGEEIWNNTAFPTDISGTYDSFDDGLRELVQDEQVYDGGDGSWDTLDGTVGTSVDEVGFWWDPTPFQAGGALEGFTASIRDQATDEVLADLAATNVLVLDADRNLVISIGVGNVPPVANDDSESTKIGVDTLIDVLANDFDPDGDDAALLLTAVDVPGGRATTVTTTQGGTATIQAGNVLYSPPNNPSDISDPDTYDTFTYTIQDEGGAEATSLVTVVVFPAEAVASRDHAERMKAGGLPTQNPVDPDAGLVVTVQIDFLDDDVLANLTKLEIVEYPPLDDQAAGNYQIATGTGVGGLDIAGDQPPDQVTGNGTSVITFSWDLSGRAIANPMSFTYRLVGPETDRLQKTFCGIGTVPNCGKLIYNLNPGAPAESDVEVLIAGSNTFLPVESLASLDVDDSTEGQTPRFYDLVDLRIIYNYQFGGGKFVDANMVTGTPYAGDAEKGAELKAKVESMIQYLDIDASSEGQTPRFFDLVDLRIVYNYQFGGGKFVDVNMVTGTPYAGDAAKGAEFKAIVEGLIPN